MPARAPGGQGEGSPYPTGHLKENVGAGVGVGSNISVGSRVLRGSTIQSPLLEDLSIPL